MTPHIANRYEISEPIGQGGMGVVYRAFDHLTGEAVALKRVHRPLATEEPDVTEGSIDTRLALAQEFKVLASVRHPNIISVLDYGFDDQRQPYFTMDLLEGAQNILDATRGQSTTTKLNLLIQVLQALAYLHRRGILHRDLKPANVLVKDSLVKVLDFGLAVTHDYISNHDPGVVGTLAYMAPEVLEGGLPSEAADLYSVGVIAYEVFAEQYPFDKTNLLYSVFADFADPTLLKVDQRLKDVIIQLLAKEPGQRFSDAGELLELYAQTTDQPIQYETASTRESFLQAAQFVGREIEFDTLNSALMRALAGQGSTWLVGGESGVGKSRLLEEIRTQALVDGTLVLRGQAISEGGTPYLVWREPLRRLCLHSQLTPLEASILKPLVPDIGMFVGYDVPDAPQISPQAAQDRLLTVIDDLFKRQQQPMVVILEDLHWAGSESLNVFKRLHPDDQHLFVVASYRDDEAPHLKDRFADVNHLKLERLTRRSITSLAISILGNSTRINPIVSLLERETEGNVFFIVEVVRALAEKAGQLDKIDDITLPDKVFAGGVQLAIQRRLARVPEQSRPLLYSAAVAGRWLDLNMLRMIAGADFNLDIWLATCNDCAVLDVQDNQWRFAHDKLREGLLADLTPEVRRYLHQQIAEAIEMAYPSNPQKAPILAHHWGKAGNTAKEHYYNALAGEQSLENAAYKEAVAFLERAISLNPVNAIPPLQRGILERQLGLAHWGAGNMQASRDHLELALTLLNYSFPKKVNLSLLRQMSEQLLRRIKIIPQRPVTDSLQHDKILQAARAYHQFSQIYYLANESTLAFHSAVRMTNLAERIGVSPELGVGYASMAIAMGFVRFDSLAETYVRLALNTARKVDRPANSASVFANTGLYRSGMGQWEQARELINQSTELCEKIGDNSLLVENLACLVHVIYYTGDIKGGLQLADRIYNIAAQTNNILHQGWGLSHKTMGLLYQGKFDAIIPLVTSSLDMLLHSPNLVTKIKTHGLLASTRVRQGRHADALDHAKILLELTEHSQPTSLATYEGHIGAAETYLKLWEADTETQQWSAPARITCTVMRQFAKVFPFGRPRALLYDGLYQFLSGKPPEAFRLWQKSVFEAGQLNMPYEAGLAHYEIGRHLPLTDPNRQHHLQSANQFFTRLGAAYDLSLVENAIKNEAV